MTSARSIAISPTKRPDFRVARVSMSPILPRDATSRHIDRSVTPWVGKPTLWCWIRSGGRLEPKDSRDGGVYKAWVSGCMVRDLDGLKRIGHSGDSGVPGLAPDLVSAW